MSETKPIAISFLTLVTAITEEVGPREDLTEMWPAFDRSIEARAKATGKQVLKLIGMAENLPMELFRDPEVRTLLDGYLLAWEDLSGGGLPRMHSAEIHVFRKGRLVIASRLVLNKQTKLADLKRFLRQVGPAGVK